MILFACCGGKNLQLASQVLYIRPLTATCFRFDECIEGGETLVLDTFPVLEELREKHPKQFEILSTIPASFQRKTIQK